MELHFLVVETARRYPSLAVSYFVVTLYLNPHYSSSVLGPDLAGFPVRGRIGHNENASEAHISLASNPVERPGGKIVTPVYRLDDALSKAKASIGNTRMEVSYV